MGAPRALCCGPWADGAALASTGPHTQRIHWAPPSSLFFGVLSPSLPPSLPTSLTLTTQHAAAPPGFLEHTCAQHAWRVGSMSAHPLPLSTLQHSMPPAAFLLLSGSFFDLLAINVASSSSSLGAVPAPAVTHQRRVCRHPRGCVCCNGSADACLSLFQPRYVADMLLFDGWGRNQPTQTEKLFLLVWHGLNR